MLPQTPAVHVSVSVQVFWSLHDAPSPFGGFEHVPVPMLHVPTSWQSSMAVHTTWFAPVHAPD